MKTRNKIVAPIDRPNACLLPSSAIRDIPSPVYLPFRRGWQEWSPSFEDACLHRATKEAADEPPNDIWLLRGCPNEAQGVVGVGACFDLEPHFTFLEMGTPTPNGDVLKEVSGSEIPAVVGINFGNSYASISVLNKVRNHHTICASSARLTSICRKGCQIASRMKMASDRLLQQSLFTVKKW